jgi:ribonuclease HII
MTTLYNLPIPTPEPNMYYIGVDEVARGCLAGPVVACAVCLDNDKVLQLLINNSSAHQIPKIADSKKLTQRQRLDADHWIKQHTLSYAIEESSITEIDTMNIRNATFLAMSRALVKCLAQLPIDLTANPDTIVNITIDGNAFVIPDPFLPDLDKPYIKYWTQVKGDAHNLNIACASIMAKEYRDAHLDSLVEQYPALACYDWSNNRAYGTKKHIDLIKQHGISNWHRKTFLSKYLKTLPSLS